MTESEDRIRPINGRNMSEDVPRGCAALVIFAIGFIFTMWCLGEIFSWWRGQ